MKVYLAINRGLHGAEPSGKVVGGGWMEVIEEAFPMLDPDADEWQWWTKDHTLVFRQNVSMRGFDDSCEIGDYIDNDNMRIRRIE